MPTQPAPVEVFCSYAHEDEAWLRKLERHVHSLKQQGLISFWYDRLIPPGTNWAKTIDKHLETASVILLLVSADFFASDYCIGIEMKRALERQEGSEALVIPILVGEVDWRKASLAHLQALPTDAKPLTLWSDEETALADVVAGIRRAIEALPLLAASAPRAVLPSVWNIPYPRNPFFLGRETELIQVRQHLQAGQTIAFSQPQAFSGLGGIGKSQLALEYAYRYHQDYQAVLWARAESIEALVSSYIALAMVLRLPEREEKKQEIVIQAVKRWLQTHSGWLLILDNADELALLSDFLPSTPGGHLLLTTRATATQGLARRLEIETFLPEQGALLLLRRAGLIAPDAELSQVSAQERDLALQISQELGSLPLALDQAGAYMEATGTDLADYWHLYQLHRADLLGERKALIPDHPASVATTWSLSFERVKKKNAAAAELLSVCAYLAPDAIPEEILTSGAPFLGPILSLATPDTLLFNQAIEALRAYSLVQRDPRGKTLSMHRLVQAVLQDTLEETERHMWVERAVLAINAAFPHSEHGTWSQCERLLPQALGATEQIKQYHLRGQEASRLLYETATYFWDHARYAESEPLYQRALAIREQQLGPDHLEVASPLNGLANIYYEQGQYGKAEPLYQRALAIREQQLGSDHPLVASSLNNLANLYKEQGQYGKAEPLYQRALAIREQKLGSDHPLVTYPLNNLALLYYQQSQYGKAEPLFLRALTVREQQLGPDHPLVASSLNNLANLYREQGQYGKAESFYQRALAIREQQLGPDHPDLANSLNNLAELYREQGQYGKAESFYQRALAIREQQLGPDLPLVAHPLRGLALLYSEQGQYGKAEPLFLRALAIREQQLGPSHPEMAEIIHDLAAFQQVQGQRQEALPLYQRALLIREQVLGAQHPKTTETRTRLITLLHTLGQHEEASHYSSLRH